MISTVSLKALEKTLTPGMRHIVLVAHTEDKQLIIPAIVADKKPLLEGEGFSGKAGESYIYNNGDLYLHFVGVGAKEKLATHDLHKPVANAVRANLKKGTQLSILPGELLEHFPKTELLKELVIAGYLASYTFDKYKKEKSGTTIQELIILMEAVTTQDSDTLRKAQEIAQSIAWTRDIVNEPSNKTTPQYLAYLLKSDEKKAPFHVEIFDGKKIQEMGMNLVWAVGKGSSEEPHFAKVTYMGNPETKKFTALVGKGVNFDTGGVQVKPDGYMNTMKGDMGGAAMVMGTMHALARLGAKVNVIAYLPFVENAVDGASYKPDDVHTAFNGVSVEIKHTDAEGRLILADALAYASQEKPEAIFDFATLTGAATVALGDKYAAIMGTNDTAIKELETLGSKINELVWRLPLHPDYRKLMDSDIADIANIGSKRIAGTIMGGIFLQEFIDASIPWVHMDIAAVATTDSKNDGINAVFATGFGVRLMVEYLTQ